MVFFLRSGLSRGRDEFLDLTLPQVVLMKHYFVEGQRAAQPVSRVEGKAAQAEFDKFMKGI